MTRRDALPLAGIVVAYLAFATLTLLDYPPVYADEPWLLSTPVSLLRHGENALPMFGEEYNASLYFDAYLVPFLALLGVSIEAGRIAAVVHGAGSLILVWLVARELGATRTAWLAPLLLVAAYPFVEVTRYVRPESFELFYGLLAIYLYLRGRTRGRSWLVTSGLSAGFAFGLFFQGAWVIILLAIWGLVELRCRPSQLAALAGGFVLALLPLVAFIANDPAEYGRFLRKFGNSSIFAKRYSDSGPLASLGDLVSTESDRYERYLVAVDSRWYVVAVVLVLAAAAAALRLPERWRYLPLLAAAPVLLAVLGANKTPGYLIIVAPAVAIAAALSLGRVSSRWSVALAAILVAAYVGVVRDHLPDVRTPFTDMRVTYRAAAQIPPGSLVIGLPTHYAYFMDDNLDFRALHYFTDFDTFELDTAAEAEAKLELDARHRRVYLFRSDGLLSTLTSFSLEQPPPPDLERLLRERFETVATLEFTATPYGDFTDVLTLYEPRHAG